MMKNTFLLLVLSVISEARIKIDITTGSNLRDAKVSVLGVDNKLVTDKEIGLYNFTKENLNRGIRIELGKAPDDIFWQDPTRYGELFKEFEWPEVRRNVRATDARIIQLDNIKADFEVVNYVNSYYNETIVYRIKEAKILENTISSTWSKKGLLNDTIHYDVNLNFNGKKELNFTDTWGNHSIIYLDASFGLSENFKSITVKPGQTVTTKLSGFKTVILIKIEYVAKLIGNLVLDYENLYGKYHFYSPTVNNIMKAAKMNNEIRTTQWIKVKCQTDPKLDVFDKDTGELVQIIEHKLKGKSRTRKFCNNTT